MDPEMFQLNKLLNDISENLGSDELKAMKFLCRDLLSNNQLDKADTGLRLFQFLQENGLLCVKDIFIVAELLYRTKQFWLLKRMKYDREKVFRELMYPGKAHVSSYRQLLFAVSEDITMKDLETVKHFLHQCLSKSKLESIKTMLDALVEMEKEGLLEESNMRLLENICKQLGEDLVAKFACYQREGRGQGEEPVLVNPVPETTIPGTPDAQDAQFKAVPSLELQSAELTGSSSSMGLQNSFSQLSVPQDQQIPAQDASISSAMITDSQDLGELDSNISHSTGLTPDSREILSRYKMESSPRGYCVIINNSIFQNMPPRRGTDRDAERLTQVFTWLGFMVRIEKNLSAAEMKKKMDECRQEDHRAFDCFVCCILTHGERGVMYGADDEQVSIRDVTSYFSASQCPSLQQKPKVFFIQACQGTERQEGIAVEEDSIVLKLEEDAVRATRTTIPDEADFLLGMATVEGYVSFRHITEGTWYIQSLCKNLEKHCPSQDLLSILTNVNNDVSEKKDKNFKTQMPQPSYTLRKKLYFPVEKSFAEFMKSSPYFRA